MTGDNGLLQKATTAKQVNQDAKELELIKLAVSAVQISGESTITKNNLESELRSNFNDNTITIEEIKDGWSYKSYKINKSGQVDKLLPKEYQQLEYIESTGTQWIDTKLEYSQCCSFDIGILMKSFRGTKNIHWGGIFINRFDWNANNSFGIQAYLNESGDEFIVVKDGELLVEYPAVKNKKYILKYFDTGLYINDTKVCNKGIGIPNIPGHFPLFGLISREINTTKIIDGEAMIGQIFHANFFNNNGVNSKKFIPCYSTATVANADGKMVPENTKGLYDLVEGKFYTNQGGEEDFKSGPEV